MMLGSGLTDKAITSTSFSDLNFEPRFATECFFLTIHCQHVALLPVFQRHMRRLGALQDFERLIVQTEQTEHQWSNHPVMAQRNRAYLRQWKNNVKVKFEISLLQRL